MAVYQGSYVELEQHSHDRVNYIVDVLLNPLILEYRNIHVYSEPAILLADNVTWKLHYPNWNEEYTTIVRKNNAKLNIDNEVFDMDYQYGRLSVGPVAEGDNVDVSYNFDYFGITTLAGFIFKAISTLNTAPAGPPTNYTIDTAPTSWDGVIVDLVGAECMRRLIADYGLWRGRLVFAISAKELEDGSSDVLNVFQTLKENFEESAKITIENPNFKIGHYIALPTQNYYAAIYSNGSGAANAGKNIKYYGRYRNRMM